MPKTAKKIESFEPEAAEKPAVGFASREDMFKAVEIHEGEHGTVVGMETADKIMENSLEDGLLLLDSMGMNRDKGLLASMVMRPAFVLKHREVFKRLVETVAKSGAMKKIQANHAQNVILDHILSMSSRLNKAEQDDDWSFFERNLAMDKELLAGITDEEKKMNLSAIDAYYAPMLAGRKLSPQSEANPYPRGETRPGIKSGRTRNLKGGEQLADEVLLQAERLLEPTYYAAAVGDIIKRYAAEHNIDLPQGITLSSVDGIFTDLEAIKEKCRALGLPFKGIESRLTAARYASLTYGVKQAEAERVLAKELNQSLIGSGWKVELNGDKYEAVEDKKGERPEQKDFDFAKFEQKSLAYIDKLLNDGADKGYVAMGLAGLDSERAWQMRDKLLNDGVNQGYVARGLAGLDSERAWQMRDKFINDGADKGYVARGFTGDYVTFVWQLKINNQRQERDLTKQEKGKLFLLNTVHRPNAGDIRHWLEAGSPAYEEHQQRIAGGARSIKNWLTRSRPATEALTDALRQNPELFLATMPAKRDRFPEFLAEQLAELIFPEIKYERELQTWRGFGGYAGLGGGESGGRQAKPEDYLNPGISHEMAGGGAEEFNDDREIMEFREAPGELVATGIYSRFSANRWQKLDFPVNAPLSEPTAEITATICDIKNLSEVSLPKPLESRVIPERAKGFDAKGKEYDLKIEINNLGEAKVVGKPKAVEKIVYSLVASQAPAPLENLSQTEYNRYKQQLEITAGRDLTAYLAQLPEDLELQLVEAIKYKNPKDQVAAIERLVRDLGYYDHNNQEVSGLKNGKSIEEQMYIMERRLEELRQKNPAKNEELAGKRFAGVCADFAQVAAALLRRAGFAGGVLTGFSGNEKTVRIKHAHATAFAVWPDGQGHNRIISVDGTPDGLAGVSLPSLAEKESMAIEKAKEFAAEAANETQKIIDSLNSLDAETVRRMSNGELEQTLNRILKYQVKKPDLAIIERLFDYYWYTPIHQLDLANVAQRQEAVLELAGAVERQRKKLADKPERDETPAGNKLMQMMSDFLVRFEVAGASENKYDALALMEKIVDLVKNDLTEIEKKAAFAVMAYLKAKNILGDEKI